MPVNVRRGLFRLWLGVSGLWVVLVGGTFWFIGLPAREDAANIVVFFVLVPPLVLLALGYFLVWVAKGFQNNN